ncbi:hypothetical protein [Okeania sp. SIO2C9]|nr:hypothetical protein [Okeania sp. SIO2C9]
MKLVFFSISSVKPEATIPAGKANIPTPTNAAIAPKNLPKGVKG